MGKRLLQLFKTSRRRLSVSQLRRLAAEHSISLLWGKPRRLFHSVFRRRQLAKSIARRHGECARCGACCRLGVTCSFYSEKNGLPSCSVHGKVRPPNCINFPISPADIADRDRVMPERRCGYHWH